MREQGVRGSGLNLYLDGDQIARITAGEVMTVYVRPGRHQVTVKPLFSSSASTRLFLESGKPATVRILDRDGNFELKLADRKWFKSFGHGERPLAP